MPEDKLEKLDVTRFSRPTDITNKWLPMKPGIRFVYDGATVEDDGKVVPHRIIINITDLVKTIADVRTLVSYDLDYTEGELDEAALAFYAQDDDGNVWRFGEYFEEYDGRKVVKAPAWIHGIQDARAGIAMKAEPRPGTPSYAQGYGPAVNWMDRGQVHAMGQEIVVGTTRYADVLVIKETSNEEEAADAAQLKYYAAGIGNIKVGWMGTGEKTKEVLDLTRVEQFDAAGDGRRPCEGTRVGEECQQAQQERVRAYVAHDRGGNGRKVGRDEIAAISWWPLLAMRKPVQEQDGTKGAQFDDPHCH